jgi:hypothetical protein
MAGQGVGTTRSLAVEWESVEGQALESGDSQHWGHI